MEKNKVMREIKFRAKDTLEGYWFVGSYIFTNDDTNNPFRSRPFKESHRIIFYSSGDWNMGGWSDVEIDPSTLGQYTGLRDKNGKEIYEGDIIKSINGKVGYVIFLQQEMGYVVVWDNCDTRLGHGNRGEGYECDGSIEVIGNIYDNPGLINKEK